MSTVTLRSAAARARRPLSRSAWYGIALVVLIAALGLVIVTKPRLLLFFHHGTTIHAVFGKALEVQVGATDVKIAGAVVGKVSGVERNDQGTMTVSMKVDSDARQLLHSNPTAALRPVTLLGGRYYIDLEPGGSGTMTEDTIGMKRTTVPIELPQVLSALQPNARDGLRATVKDLDGALGPRGVKQLRRLVTVAPDSLAPAGNVLRAVEGQNPGSDLPRLVTTVNRLAATATRENGQVQSILDSLAVTARSLDAASDPLDRAVADLPSTLGSTRTGLSHLQGTLTEVQETSDQLRPVVNSLNTTLGTALPVLRQARPVVRKARGLLADLNPTVKDLVPTARHADGVLTDLRGPVLTRLEGPVVKALDTKWRGTGVYDGDGATGRALYEEAGVLAARFNNLSKQYDQNGPYANLQLGVGTNSLGGTPADRLLLALTKIWGSPK